MCWSDEDQDLLLLLWISSKAEHRCFNAKYHKLIKCVCIYKETQFLFSGFGAFPGAAKGNGGKKKKNHM